MANIRHIDPYDMNNGFFGGCTALWWQGCEHRCPECHNPETWSTKIRFDRDNKEIAEEVLGYLDEYFPKHLSILGGDPLMPYNRDDAMEIIQIIKERRPHTKVACWTGYTWDEIKHLKILQYIDVLVDGRFEKDLLVTGKKYGSSNQKVIDVRESLRKDEIVIYSGY